MTFKNQVHSSQNIGLPAWGRCLWQDPNDGVLFLAYVTGNNRLVYSYSTDSGNVWLGPNDIAPVDDFSFHWNFDTFMDPRGHIHCTFRYQDSGCYQFLGKSGSLWTKTSGENDPQGFILVNDTSPYARSLQASLYVLDGESNYAGGTPYTENPCPKVVIACKESGNGINFHSLHTPFKGTPTGITPYAPTFPPTFYGGSTNQHGTGPFLGGTLRNNETAPGALHSTITTSPPATPGNGTLTRLYFAATSTLNSNIRAVPSRTSGFCSGLANFNFLVVTAPAQGAEMFINLDIGGGIPNNIGIDVIKRRVEEINDKGHVTGLYPGSFGTQRNNLFNAISSTGIYGMAESGTAIDITFNENGDFVLYCLDNTEYGRNSIRRNLLKIRQPAGPAYTLLTADMKSYPSGHQFIIEPGADIAGGKNGIPHIENFKTIKHPTGPGGLVKKIDGLAIITTPPLSSSGNLLTYLNVLESNGLQPFKLPHFLIDYSKTSGTGPFQGVESTFSVSDSYRMFDKVDNDLYGGFGGHHDVTFAGERPVFSNAATINSGSNMLLSFSRPVTIERLDIVGSDPTNFMQWQQDTGEIIVSGSLDGSVFYRCGVIPSGSLTGGSAQRRITRGLACDKLTVDTCDVSTNPANRRLYSFVPAFTAKYLKFDWALKYNSAEITDIRIFGEGSTSFGARRFPSILDLSNYQWNIFHGFQLRQSLPRTERFRHDAGTLPPGWLSYGQAPWKIASSGKFTTSHEMPGYPQSESYEGKVPSGIFSLLNEGHGFDDGSSVYISPKEYGLLDGTSGVLEYHLRVSPNIRMPGANANALRSGDFITFKMRSDMDADDELRFFTHWRGTTPSPTVGPVEDPFANQVGSGIMRIYQTGALHDWRDYRYFLCDGDWTLRWIYRKGPSESINSYGAVWIDNVYGVSGAPPGSIQGYVQTSTSYATGYINGYTTSHKLTSEIYGLTVGGKLVQYVLGFTDGGIHPDASSHILGFVKGNNQGYILGTLLGSPSGGDVILTYPTGYIHGFVMVPSGSGPSNILGYVEGDWGTSIMGYLRGYSTLGASGSIGPEATGDNRIWGFVRAIDAASSILGVVGGSGSLLTPHILGFVNARHGDGNQTIYGWLSQASGDSSIIHGYSQGHDFGSGYLSPNQSIILGYVSTDAKSSGNINGYVIAQMPSGFIYGYLGSEALVASGGGSVGGGPGAGSIPTSNVAPGQNYIWGYLKGDSPQQTILGYVHAPPGGYSEILGYVLAGATDDRIYGYLVGNSSAGTGIYGYTSGVGYGNSNIFGYTYGVSGINNSNILGFAIGHNEPTSTILGTMIGVTSGDNSLAACPSHNFNLVSVPVIVMPSSFYNFYR